MENDNVLVTLTILGRRFTVPRDLALACRYSVYSDGSTRLNLTPRNEAQWYAAVAASIRDAGPGADDTTILTYALAREVETPEDRVEQARRANLLIEKEIAEANLLAAKITAHKRNQSA